MLGHKKDTKNVHYLGQKKDDTNKHSLGHKDFLSQSSQHQILRNINSTDGIYNNSNSRDAQNEPLKKTKF